MAKVILSQKKRLGLQQAAMIVFVGMAAIVLLALLSYDRNDPGPIIGAANHLGGCSNWAGCKGAWLAAFLIGLLGYLAYALPVGLVVLGMTAFRFGPHMKNPNNPEGGINDVIAAMGAVFALLSAAGLAHLLFEGYPFVGGGGMLGRAVGNFLSGTFLGEVGAALLLLSILLGSITIVGEISWMEVFEQVGDWMIRLFDKLQEYQQTAGAAGQEASSASATAGSGQGGLFGRFSDTLTQSMKTGGEALSKANAWVGKMVGDRGMGMTEGPDVTEIPAPNSRQEPNLAAPEWVAASAATTQAADDVFADAPPAAVTASQPAANVVDLAEGARPHAKPKRKGSGLLLPPLTMLNPPPKERATQSKERLNELADKLVEALGHYGVRDVRVVAKDPGPVITRFELELPDGTKASKISGLASDLARNLCVSSVRVVEVIPGRPTIGIEIPNDKRDVVTISELLSSSAYKKSTSPLTLALGKDIAGYPVVADLARMPHLLVAGTTGSGKSVFVNAVLMSLVFKARPDEVRMIMIDPKMLELSSYEDIPHLLAPVVTDMKHAANALRWCVAEMERRYLLMSKFKVRNISGFNEKLLEAQERGEVLLDPLFDPLKSVDGQPQPLKPLPYIVVVIDEFADMMMVVGKKVEELIARLAQKARAAGIHLILATQRPSVDVITGLIKANIPTRIAFQVSTKIDSRTILDQGGAEQLLGYGDMLYMPPGTSLPLRVHGALVTDREVEDVTNYLKLQGEPEYIEDVLADSTSPSDAIPGLEPLTEREGGTGEADPLFDEAVAIVTEARRASISYLQRRLKVGYNRAARLIEDMEAAGVVSPVLSNGSRDVLAPPPPKD